jgi:hypothetical protein
MSLVSSAINDQRTGLACQIDQIKELSNCEVA